jgi:NADPH-dependent 2,4-dienoyl-CoA reductase/sulfur reductase-like enzyme
VVIIGTGLAGYGLAREFRKHDSDTPLLLITEDDGRAYSKPMLSTGYTKDTDAAALTQNDAGTMATNLNAQRLDHDPGAGGRHGAQGAAPRRSRQRSALPRRWCSPPAPASSGRP